MLVPMRSSSVALSSFCRATLAGRRERCQGYSVSMTVNLAIAGVTGRMRLWTVMGEGWAALELDRDRTIVYTLLVSDAVPGACCEAPFFFVSLPCSVCLVNHLLLLRGHRTTDAWAASRRRLHAAAGCATMPATHTCFPPRQRRLCPMATRNGVPLNLHDRTVPSADDLARLFSAVQHPKKLAYLLAFSECGQVGVAAKRVGIDRNMPWIWEDRDPLFAEAYAVARKRAVLALQEEAIRRAMGWDETHVDAQGTPHTVRKASDTLLIFLLKGLMPETYREHGKRDGHEISELLKAVLLELHRHEAQQTSLPATYTPLPSMPTALPAPPSPDEEAGEPVPWREPAPWDPAPPKEPTPW